MRLDRTRNEKIREKVGVTTIENKMRETKLRWFSHIKMRSVYVPVRMCEMINCSRGRRQSKES